MLLLTVTALLLVSGTALRLSETQQHIKDTKKSDTFKAVIVHCDNRPLNDKDPSAVKIEDMSFVEMASVVDYAYAQKHGYEFRHYVLPHTILHPTFGRRHSAWAKLLALKQAGNDYPDADLLMVHDSDTAVSNHGPSLPEFMDAFTLTEYNHTRCPTCWHNGMDYGVLFQTVYPVTNKSVISRLKQASGIWLNQGCKGHMILAKPGELAWEVLKKAWNFNEYQETFPWEQAAWDRLAVEQTEGLLMIGGVNAKGHRIDPSNIEIPGFNKHICHFQDDSMAVRSYGDRSARDRVREGLGCGMDWKEKCFDNPAYQEAVSEHDFFHGQRKLLFLNLLRHLRYDDNDILRLYREMRAKVTYFSEDEANALSDRLSKGREMRVRATGGEQSAEAFKSRLRNLFEVADPIPEDSRERECWCDGP
jgi:hypothetical protein